MNSGIFNYSALYNMPSIAFELRLNQCDFISTIP